MSGNAPTACAALPARQKNEGFPLVYWFQGAMVRSFLQDEKSGLPTDRWEDNEDHHGVSWPLDRKAQSYGDAFSKTKGKLGVNGPIDVFVWQPQKEPHPLLCAVVPGEGSTPVLRSFDPEAAGKILGPVTPGELQKKLDSGALSGACEMDDPDRILLFGHAAGKASAYWMWNTRAQVVSEPFAMPKGFTAPVEAAFLGYDTKPDANALDKTSRVMRLYQGGVEQAFTVTPTDSTQDVGPVTFFPQKSAGAFLPTLEAKLAGKTS
ncbi:hypothetical protein ACIBK8_35110 [Streptomyces sp. NPDC050161]|uniref:hypothetical protein n=1 Tax=Streptomyces sp. NPDC050161 TaxID=3365604 RepID=UPI0037AFBC86